MCWFHSAILWSKSNRVKADRIRSIISSLIGIGDVLLAVGLVPVRLGSNLEQGSRLSSDDSAFLYVALKPLVEVAKLYQLLALRKACKGKKCRENCDDAPFHAEI